MPDAWIALDPAARRRNWWWTAVLTLLCAGTAIAAALSAAADPWWWAGGVGAFWLFSAFYMINRGYGRTLLTADRIVFRTFLSRRSIPWAEIIRVEKRSHQTRSGQWWDLRIVRVNGRPITIPGAFSNKWCGDDLDRQLALLHAYWSHSARN
ncbi:hypothetical protein K4749_40270 [Streptomyces sp. TRM72054]|uniref:hypothetical protein n=1 Tax=Streptomyces sp. TRM72054 TaxID=2870562 RepID=UPI001C8C5427|nr:hypothetical protein [Streptomyces sp. TRM72054]MBX9399585.1 hypothetical protein [Streptomyces sp. TRM72054]